VARRKKTGALWRNPPAKARGGPRFGYSGGTPAQRKRHSKKMNRSLFKGK